jgi:ABC-type dipeptide/oligopeptide/nickel transport system permease component
LTSGRFLSYIAGRLAIVCLAAVALSWTVFLLVHALPGNPFSGSERMTDAREQLLIHRAHLDDPYPLQYLHWLDTYFNGGLSPVLLGEAWTSIRLGLFAIVLMLGVGIWAGVASAANRGTRIDHLAGLGGSIAYAVPNFVWAMWLSFFFTALLFRWTGGLLYIEVGWGQPVQWVLPAVALATPQAGLVARIVRSSMLDTLGQDYVRTAWAKGLQERAVLLRHALRNALIPLVTVMGPIAVSTLMGSLVVENVFGVPGLGPELVRSIFSRAYFTATGVFTYYSLLAGLAMLLVDVAYVAIDPKIRY